MELRIGEYLVEKVLKTQNLKETCLVLSSNRKDKYIAKTFKKVNIYNGLSKVIHKITAMFKTNPEQEYIKMLKSLKHPNIVQFIDSFYFNSGNELAIILQKCGSSFSDEYIIGSKNQRQRQKVLVKLQKYNKIPEIVRGVLYLHENQIVHKNLKFQNLFLTENSWNQKVKIDVPYFTFQQNKFSNKIQYYNSIQILEKKQYSKQSDIFALGIIFLQLLTGKRIYDLIEQQIQPCRLMNFPQKIMKLINNRKYLHLILGMVDKNAEKRLKIKKINDIVCNKDIFVWQKQLKTINLYQASYKGEIQNGKREGNGLLKEINGNTYFGEWKNDQRNGWGRQYKYTRYDSQTYSEGEWLNDQQSGWGKRYTRYELQTYYEGEWLNDQRSGYGVQSDIKKREIYEGQWKNNEKNGEGVAYFRGRMYFVGEWKYNKIYNKGISIWDKQNFSQMILPGNQKQTEGIIIKENGKRYEGEWCNGNAHRKGVIYYKNGDIFEGQFSSEANLNKSINQLCECANGVCYYANGDHYKGQWKDDQPHGKGVMNYANGSKYEGFFKSGHFDGQGKHFYANGDQYEGGSNNHYAYKEGIMRYANGNRFEGGWFRNQRFWGIMTYANGDQFQGVFFHYFYHYQWHSGTMRYANGDNYHGEWIYHERSGKGRQQFINGDIYEGEWLHDQINGKGIMIYASGQLFQGYWEMGQRIENNLVPQ